MAYQVRKHEAKQVLEFSDNSGGVNISQEPDKIAENECVNATNFQFNYYSGKFCTRPAIDSPIDTESQPVTHIWYDSSTRLTYFFVGGAGQKKTIKVLNGAGVISTIGQTSGNIDKPKCLNFGGNVFIASGRKLQAYLVQPPPWLVSQRNRLVTLDGSSVAGGVLNDSPNVDVLYYKSGRLVCATSGDDTIYYSAVGDALSEKAIGIDYDDPDDESSAKYISNVGADDAGKFLTIVPMSTDIVVFKTSGNVYTVSGEAPNWYISLIGTNSDAVGANAIVTFANDVAFVSTQGLRKLTNSATYGNYSTEEFGGKCNPDIMDGVSNPWIADLRDRRQMVVAKNNYSDLYIFHYNLGAFTTWNFGGVTINAMAETQNGVLVGGVKDNQGFLAYLSDTIVSDFNEIPIQQTYKSRVVHDYDLLNSHINNVTISTELGDGNTTVACNGNTFATLDANTAVKHVRTQIRAETLQYSLSTTNRINIEHLSATVITSTDGSGARNNGTTGQWTALADAVNSR